MLGRMIGLFALLVFLPPSSGSNGADGLAGSVVGGE